MSLRAVMNLLLLSVLLSLFLASCASTATYEKTLDTWVGADVSSLIEKWGPPANEYKLPNGNVMFTWLFNGGTVAMPIGNMAYAVNRTCKTTFTTNTQGVIQNWRWEGNACEQ